MPEESTVPALRMRGLTKRYGTFVALDSVDLDVHQGETLCVIGRSGSGKSTLLKACNLLEIPEAGVLEVGGSTYFDGKAVSRGKLKELRTRTAMVFQSFELFPHLSALENVAIAPIHVKKVAKKDARERARQLLSDVGLDRVADSLPGALSGGQQQRVSIARALALDPEVLLFDEPTSALDPEMVGEVLAIMRKLAANGSTMIVVTHEMRFARDVASTVVVMDEGAVLESGRPDQVFSDPKDSRTQEFMRRLQWGDRA